MPLPVRIYREYLMRKVDKLCRQPLFVWIWLSPVWALLGFSKALIFVVPFNRLHPWLGDDAGIAPLRPLIDPLQIRRAIQIGHVINLAARLTPWNTNCFPQAIVARILLGLYKIPYALCLGVKRDPAESGLQAHAWVAAGSVNVTGGASFARYTVVAMFLSPLMRQR